MKKPNKYSFVLLTFFVFSFQLFGQEKKEIELYKKLNRPYDGVYNTPANLNQKIFVYQWRYVNSSRWHDLGLSYQNIKPILDQYESSAKLLKQSINVPRYGLFVGGTLFVGGIITTMTSLNTESNAQAFIGIGASLAGISTIVITYKVGIKKFEKSVEEYNKMVRNDSGSNRTLKLGLAYNNMSSSPLLCFQLSI